jgi:undecaprenyl-diphosphatase
MQTTRHRHHHRSAALVAAGLGLLLLGVLLLEGERAEVPGWEADLFSAINGWSSSVETAAIVVMQAGNFWAIVIVAGVLLLARQRRAALAVALAGTLAWAGAKAVKRLIERGRPFDLLDAVTVREDGITGLGFVSGHTATAFAIATALLPWLPRRWRWLPFAVACVVGLARVYVGAHLPLDVIGGAGLGIACGALATWIVGYPDRGASLPDDS